MNWRIENTDALSLLRELPDNWAQTCITSPPLTGPVHLRDCENQGRTHLLRTAPHKPTGYRTRYPVHWPSKARMEWLLAVFREARRVLRYDATLWLALSGTPQPRASELVTGLRAQGWTIRDLWHVGSGERGLGKGRRLLLLTPQPGYFFQAQPLQMQTRHWSTRRQITGFAFVDRRGQHAQHKHLGSAPRRGCAWQASRCVPACREGFPVALARACVIAGSAPHACASCGEPLPDTPPELDSGAAPGCAHRDRTGRCLVLDPFCGSALAGAIAHRLGRSYLGIEADAHIARLARQRLAAIAATPRRTPR